MKKYQILIALTLLLITLNSCTVVTGIFKAGMGFGIFTVVLVIIIIAALIMRANKK